MKQSSDDPSFPPGVATAIAYANDVTDARVAACRLVHLTCERFLLDLKAAQTDQGSWAFRPELAERAMTFAGLLPNIRGPEAGQPLRLMPWQRLVFANLFGFVERSTNDRRFRQAVVFVPRGNGKTSIAAPLALYLTFMDGEGGAEGYAAAVSRDQARLDAHGVGEPDGGSLGDGDAGSGHGRRHRQERPCTHARDGDGRLRRQRHRRRDHADQHFGLGELQRRAGRFRRLGHGSECERRYVQRQRDQAILRDHRDQRECVDRGGGADQRNRRDGQRVSGLDQGRRKQHRLGAG